MYAVSIMLFGLTCGMVAVASNPSPYFAAFGLVAVAGFGCGTLVGFGGSFLGLMLFLIYLGGMLVVFGYSAAMAADPHPEGLGSGPVMMSMMLYLAGLTLGASVMWAGEVEQSWCFDEEGGEFYVLGGDIGGVGLMYAEGGWMLVASAWMLLLTLFVVLELTRGLSRGSLQAV
nr:NADH dehydrogenase subunit 6 [Taenianotus triacanthus]